MLHYFFTASLTWMFVEALHLFLKIVSVFNIRITRMRYYAAIGWGKFRDTFCSYNLRGTQKLDLPRVTTTTYGLHSFRYAATQVWNMLPDDIRTSESLIAFKRAIQDITV